MTRLAATRAVLVADDSVAVRRLVTARLAHDGYDVREAEDGLDALRRIDEQRPDVLIVDDVLPCLSGAELVAAIRAQPATAALPVLFLCEYPAGLARASQAGLAPDAVVRKPLDLIELSTRVRSLGLP